MSERRASVLAFAQQLFIESVRNRAPRSKEKTRAIREWCVSEAIALEAAVDVALEPQPIVVKTDPGLEVMGDRIRDFMRTHKPFGGWIPQSAIVAAVCTSRDPSALVVEKEKALAVAAIKLMALVRQIYSRAGAPDEYAYKAS